MPKIDSEKFYSAAIKKYGSSPQGVHWISKQTQEIRFKMIADMLPQKLDSLVDAGCGFGDFFYYLKQKKIACKKYIGIDSHKKMCAVANKYTNQNIQLKNILHDPLPQTDYYICSGAMNILNGFETHLFIRNCFSHVNRGFIFNILLGNQKSNIYNYTSFQTLHKIINGLNPKKVLIKSGYLEHDITIGLFK